MTQLEIYNRQLEIAKQLLEITKNNNMNSKDISMCEELCDLCKSSIEKIKTQNKNKITHTIEPQERGGNGIIYTSSCEWCNRDTCEDCYNEDD